MFPEGHKPHRPRSHHHFSNKITTRVKISSVRKTLKMMDLMIDRIIPRASPATRLYLIIPWWSLSMEPYNRRHLQMQGQTPLNVWILFVHQAMGKVQAQWCSSLFSTSQVAGHAVRQPPPFLLNTSTFLDNSSSWKAAETNKQSDWEAENSKLITGQIAIGVSGPLHTESSLLTWGLPTALEEKLSSIIHMFCALMLAILIPCAYVSTPVGCGGKSSPFLLMNCLCM